MDNLISELESWYHLQCNGEWEHDFGIMIETIDNPGWHLKIDLKNTFLEQAIFEEYQESYEDDSEWLICKKTEGQFDAAGGPKKLEDMK